MNTKTNTRPTRPAMIADDAGMAAYRAARRMGADPVSARRAFDSAYAAAMRG